MNNFVLFDFSDFVVRHTNHKDFQGECNCRMAAYIAQNGRCYVTARQLEAGNRELHHRLPRFYGGKDLPSNTILLDKRVHKLIHSANPRTIRTLLAEIQPTEAQKKLIDQLRHEAHMPAIWQAADESAAS